MAAVTRRVRGTVRIRPAVENQVRPASSTPAVSSSRKVKRKHLVFVSNCRIVGVIDLNSPLKTQNLAAAFPLDVSKKISNEIYESSAINVESPEQI